MNERFPLLLYDLATANRVVANEGVLDAFGHISVRHPENPERYFLACSLAVCHHHAPAVLPYCISGERLVPVFILGGVLGHEVPFWDQRDDFGDTNMLVQRSDEGASLARALGPHMAVLMRRHGATVVGRDLRELVFRTIYGARNAEYQTQARLIGNVSALSAGEATLIGAQAEQPGALSRAWEYWVTRLAKRNDLPKRPDSV